MRKVDNQYALKHMDERSVQNWGDYIGVKPDRLGLVATMYPDNTLMNFVDSVMNVYSKKQKTSYEGTNSTIVEWDIETEFIKKVYVAVTNDVSTTSANGAVFQIAFKEKYFEYRDVFYVGEGRQTFIVLSAPKRMGTDKWYYDVRLVTNDMSEIVTATTFVKDAWAVYSHNAQSEYSERGYVKHQANRETHFNHMTFVRHSDYWSMKYATMEDHFMETLNEDGKKELLVYKKKEKAVVDAFMRSRESLGLHGNSTFDKNGKCLMQDPNDNQDIEHGDGIVKQIEKFAEIFAIETITTEILEEMLSAMKTRSGKIMGNKYVVMANSILWEGIQRLMKSDNRWMSTTNEFYSKEVGGMVETGATFKSYEFAGNIITFMANKALTDRYPTKAYGIVLDANIDENTGKPNVAAYALKGNEFITGRENGMGGQDGKTSGIVNSGLTASAFHVYGSVLYVVHNPYKSLIIRGN